MKGKRRTEDEALVFIDPLVPLLQRGMSEREACDYADIPESTLNLYKEKYPKVWSKIRRARMQIIAIASSTVYDSAGTDPKIALEVLKRKSKEAWGDAIDVTTGGNAIQDNHAQIKDIALKLDTLLADEQTTASAGDSERIS